MSDIACEVDQYCQPAGQAVVQICWLKPSAFNVGIPANKFVTVNKSCRNECSCMLWQVLSNDVSMMADEPQHTFHKSYSLPLQRPPLTLACINEDCVLVGDVDGSLHTVTTANGPDTLQLQASHTAAHSFNGAKTSCNHISAWAPNNVVSCGDDGCIRLLDVTKNVLHPPRQLGPSILSVAHSTASNIVCGSLDGLIQVVDLRMDAKANSIQTRSVWSDGAYSTLSVCCNPAQNDIVVAGSESGMIAICDLRMPSHFLSTTHIHSGPVLQVKFHSSYTDNLFSCSADGSLLHIDGSSVEQQKGDTDRQSIWCGGDKSVDQMKVVNLIPEQSLAVNSFDISCRNIICATDSETIILTSDLLIA